MEYYQIIIGGTKCGIVETKREALDDIEYNFLSEGARSVEIETVVMSEQEYEALPEFQGP